MARYVVPEINGYIDGLRRSQKFVIENRAVFERAGQAVMAKILRTTRRQLHRRRLAPAALRSPPSTRRICRRKPKGRRNEKEATRTFAALLPSISACLT